MPSARPDPASLPDRLTDLWRSLESAARLPTQTLAWAEACAEALHPESASSILAVEGAVGPLVRRGLRLELLGVEELSEPSDLLARDADSLGALADELAASGRPLRFERVPADSPTVAAILGACSDGSRVRIRPVGGAPFVRLSDGWTEPLAMLSSRRRADLKRARKRAETDGPIRVEIHAPTPEEADAVLDVAWDVESRSWRVARKGTLVQDTVLGPFFRSWAERAAADGTLRVALLYTGDTPIAMQLATVFADGWWLLKVGYDEAASRASPGILLMTETIRRAAEEGLATYELMGAVEPWTHVWTQDIRECVAIRTYPYSSRGALAWLSDAARAAGARLIRSTS